MWRGGFEFRHRLFRMIYLIVRYVCRLGRESWFVFAKFRSCYAWYGTPSHPIVQSQELFLLPFYDLSIMQAILSYLSSICTQDWYYFTDLSIYEPSYSFPRRNIMRVSLLLKAVQGWILCLKNIPWSALCLSWAGCGVRSRTLIMPHEWLYYGFWRRIRLRFHKSRA